MAIPTWVLPAPVLVGPGQRVAAYQLRELTLRFPPDGEPGGAVTLTPIKVDGQPHHETVALALTPDDLTQFAAATSPDAVLAAVAALFNTRDVVDLGKATIEMRLPVTPVVATPAMPSAGGAVVSGLG